jgi:hypothetical protein
MVPSENGAIFWCLVSILVVFARVHRFNDGIAIDVDKVRHGKALLEIIRRWHKYSMKSRDPLVLLVENDQFIDSLRIKRGSARLL